MSGTGQPACAAFYAGVVDYATGVKLQARARKLVEDGIWDGVLILLQHQPVITIGRSGGAENLLLSPRELAARGIELADSNRGGNITCHNPGQLVGYPILNLNVWQPDVHWYLRTLEDVLIKTLAHYGLQAGKKQGYTGVWLGDAKVAAIGVAVKHWITEHGFALNVNNDLTLFNSIVPCGIKEFGVTSLVQHIGQISIPEVRELIQDAFGQVFACNWGNLAKLGEYSESTGTSTLVKTEINGQYVSC